MYHFWTKLVLKYVEWQQVESEENFHGIVYNLFHSPFSNEGGQGSNFLKYIFSLKIGMFLKSKLYLKGARNRGFRATK